MADNAEHWYSLYEAKKHTKILQDTTGKGGKAADKDVFMFKGEVNLTRQIIRLRPRLDNLCKFVSTICSFFIQSINLSTKVRVNYTTDSTKPVEEKERKQEIEALENMLMGSGMLKMVLEVAAFFEDGGGAMYSKKFYRVLFWSQDHESMKTQTKEEVLAHKRQKFTYNICKNPMKIWFYHATEEGN